MTSAPLLIILMWAGLLWSRALLSMSMIAFFVVALIFFGRAGWKAIRSSRWLTGLLLLFIIPFLTFCWSADKGQWLSAVQVKIPLLLMPFLIPLFRSIPKAITKKLLGTLLLMVLLSTLYSYWHFFAGGGMAEEYLKAKVLKVAMSNDHVRFAWLLIIAYAWLLYELLKGEWTGVWKMAGYGMLVYLAIFIHVMAAKTGLLGFYLVNLIAVFSMVPLRFRPLAIGLLLLLPLLCWYLLPSFQNRLRFVLWDYQNYSRGNYVEGLSDAPRMISYEAGSSIVQAAPLTGVGSGDVLFKTLQWYNNHAPYLKDYEKLLPSNELLMYACAAGIGAGFMALLIFLWPFFMQGYRRNMLWISFHTISFAGFMYEIGLEVQYGVFLYAFFSCWFYVLLSPAAEAGTASHT